ncbi:hypothetical protein XM25_00765 [Devosia sp. H5989]|nr:hypothetical protein XM25_00765 [Devosia sp. H5989]
MSFFQHVEGEAAVLVENGVFRQCDLYTRDGYLYAKTGAGFVRLMADGSTSRAKLRLDFMSWTGDLARDPYGRLCFPDVAKAKKLGGADAQRLLGAPAE